MSDNHAHLLDQLEVVRLFVELQTPGTDHDALLARLQQAVASVRQREQDDPDLAISKLSRRLGLTAEEQRIFLVALATTIDGRTRQLVTSLHGRCPVSSLELCHLAVRSNQLGAALECLTEAGSLISLGLLESSGSSTAGDLWTVPLRLISWIHGTEGLAPELRPIARLLVASDAKPLEEVFTSPSCVSRAERALAEQHHLVVYGVPGLGRRTLARALLAKQERGCMEIDCVRLEKDPHRQRIQLRSIARECRLLECTPLLLNIDALTVDGLANIESILARHIRQGLVMTAGTHRPPMRWLQPVVEVELEHPTSKQRASRWKSALGNCSQQDAEHLAERFPLVPALIQRAADVAKTVRTGESFTPEDIYTGVRSIADDRLGKLAKRVSTSQSWKDLVLSGDQVLAIQELIARVEQRTKVFDDWGFAKKIGRGVGITTLFSGPPGTGKTMVAGLIGKTLHLDVFQVDLSKIVSKWIGDTEKHLAEIFDAAEASGAILLFDEADSLFAKRTEVRSSNDRNSNLETNYLLQRLEQSTCIVMLTTNHESSIDPAFQRRLSLHLRFALPDEIERALLWERLLPDDAPREGELDAALLARQFPMSGGYIRNAVLRAAFHAAREESAITQQHLETGARLEYESMGKLVLHSKTI